MPMINGKEITNQDAPLIEKMREKIKELIEFAKENNLQVNFMLCAGDGDLFICWSDHCIACFKEELETYIERNAIEHLDVQENTNEKSDVVH